MIIILLFLIILLFATIGFDLRSNLSQWLITSILGLGLAVFSFVVYSVNMWDFSYFVRKILLLNNRSLYLWVYYLNLSAFTVIRLLNVGIVMFLYCTTVFAFEYYHFITYRVRKKFKGILLILPIIYLIGYDPLAINSMYHLFFHMQIPFFKAETYYAFFAFFNAFNKFWMVGYLVLSLGIIARSLRCAYHDQIRHKTIMLGANLLTLYLIFNVIFYWTPRIMFTPRGLGFKGKFYAQPYVGLNIKFFESTGYYLLILFTAIATGFFLVSLYKYNVTSTSRKKHRQYFETSYQSANISSQAFIHAFKNDLFAIQTLSAIDSPVVTPELASSRFKDIYEVSTACMHRFDLLHKAMNHTKITLKTVPISHLITKALTLVSSSSSAQSEIEVSPILDDLTAYVDEIQTIEVIRNILTNSLESLYDGQGKISIEASRKSRWAVIIISDTGCGISKEGMKKIFNPYYSTKPSPRNWGLGLSFCRKIIQLMDGDILVESKEGKGSRFSIYLPLPPLK